MLLDAGGWTENRLAERCPQVGEHLEQARRRLAEAGHAVATLEARTRYGWIGKLDAGCVQRPAQRPATWTDRIDRVLTHRLWGTLIFLGIMFLVFQSIFTGAGPLMDVIRDRQGFPRSALRGLRERYLPAGPLTSLLTDGILEGVGGVRRLLAANLVCCSASSRCWRTAATWPGPPF